MPPAPVCPLRRDRAGSGPWLAHRAGVGGSVRVLGAGRVADTKVSAVQYSTVQYSTVAGRVADTKVSGDTAEAGLSSVVQGGRGQVRGQSPVWRLHIPGLQAAGQVDIELVVGAGRH